MAWHESLNRKITDTVVYGYAYPCIFPQQKGATHFRLRENISMSFIGLFCGAIFRVSENFNGVLPALRVKRLVR